MRREMTSQSVEKCALRACSTHGVHHAIVEINVVIGVVPGELHVVVRVHVPLVPCDDAVIDLQLGQIAHVVIVDFVVTIFQRILLYWRKTVHRNIGLPKVVPGPTNVPQESKMTVKQDPTLLGVVGVVTSCVLFACKRDES